jgi:hypothetical protein
VARLTVKGVSRRLHYLLVAPIVAAGLQFLLEFFSRTINGQAAGLVAGFIYGFIQAAALSLVLFVGRAIIEQRQLDLDAITTGLGAFLNDTLTVLFVFFVINLILPQVAGILFIASVAFLPLMETVALAPVSGFGIFEAAINTFRRDAFPWLAGQIPMVALLALWVGWTVIVEPLLPGFLAVVLGHVVMWALVLVAFVYRGVLFLTLDGSSPRRRAERFGGEAGLG